MAQISFPKLEEDSLGFWEKNNIFQKTLDKPSPNGEFIFYEGPPTANGKPAIHHVLARSFKDAVPRYKTMRGFHVVRKAGWDTHGLPVELQVEKALQISGKPDIEKYGIAEFNKKCKESVWEFKDEWERLTKRMGYWVDLDDPYITYDNDYIESVWWILSQVNKKGLLYRGHKVVPHCPRCGTALSSHEVAQGYKEVKDTSVYIKFKLKTSQEIDGVGVDENTFILSWTTTPWTLPGNIALAVGSAINYIKIELDTETGKEFYILAKDLVAKVFGEDVDYKTIKEFKGKDLVGLEYEALFPGAIPESTENFSDAYYVYVADFVTTIDGTGVVHTAVMYGEDDYQLAEEIGLPKHHIVSPDGKYNFTNPTGILEKLNNKPVKHKDRPTEEITTNLVLEYLKENNLLLKTEKYKHDYPYCWRCDTPLLYYAKNSWFIAMSKLRKELKKNNEQINWVPGHIKSGRFGEWLDGVKDWAISRERYWGTPLPVWVSEDNNEIEVIGSRKELYQKAKKNKPTRIIFVRHGESEKNVSHTMSSAIDKHPLTHKGEKQAKEYADILASENIDVVYSSPILRSKESAEIINKKLRKDIIINDNLAEEHYGEWEEKTTAEIHKTEEYKKFNTLREANDPAAFDMKKGRNGETFKEVQSRLFDTIDKIIKEHQGKTVLIVTHQFQIVAMLQKLRSLSIIETIRKFRSPSTQMGAQPFEFYLDKNGNELDLHKPSIDDITVVSAKGTELKRDKTVLDVWFDSGAMPYAQVHYPFENKELIDNNRLFPADFISEAIDQTRGWFYTLLAVSTLLDKGTPYKNVICLAHINDKHGKKMSKSKGNVIAPWEMMDKYGVDAVRFLFYTMNQPGETKNFDPYQVEQILKKNWLILWNVLNFYKMYIAVVDTKNKEFKESDNVLDQWILAKTTELHNFVTEKLDNYDLTMSGRAVIEFINELSTWYIRRSRDRFKAGGEEQLSAVQTLGKVLLELSKIMAPFTPFISEQLYQEIKLNYPGEYKFQESVHIDDWSELEKLEKNQQTILEEMTSVRAIVEQALAMRAEAGIKTRQPLAALSVVEDLDDDMIEILKEEVNVKEIKTSAKELLLDTKMNIELEQEGMIRELTRQINSLRKQAKLTIHDRVILGVKSEDDLVVSSLNHYKNELLKATLSTELTDAVSDLEHTEEIVANDKAVTIAIKKID